MNKNRLISFTLYFFLLLFSGGCFLACENGIKVTKEAESYYAPVVDTILNHSNRKFIQFEKSGITFYYEEDSFFIANILDLSADAVNAREKCLQLLGENKITHQLKVIYFNDREKIRPYLNMAPKGIALPDAYTLLIAANDTVRAYHTHEMMHILSSDKFGGYAATPSGWIQEGISVYADNPCLGYAVHEIAAYMLLTGKMVLLDSLFRHFRALPDMAAYMYAGSVVGFIIEKYGMDKLEQLWKQGVAKLPLIINKTTAEFENEYYDFLKQKYPQQPVINWQLLNDKGCG